MMMRVNCRHCGAINEVDLPESGQATVVCFACGRPFYASSADEDETMVSGAATVNLMPPMGTGGYPFAPQPQNNRAYRPAQLDPMPQAGLDALLQSPAQDAPYLQAAQEANALHQSGAFRFAFDELPDSDEQFHVGSEATKVVASPASLMQSANGWRLRSERGVVYDLATIDALVAMLKGRPDLASIEIAQGDGPFAKLDRYPEIYGRLGDQKSAERSSAMPSRVLSGSRQRGVRTELSSKKTQISRQTLGFGSVLLAIGVVAFLAVGIVSAAMTVGWMRLPACQVIVPKEPRPISKELQNCIKKLNGGATEVSGCFEGLQADESATKYYYLMKAYCLENRSDEAEKALVRYKRIRGNE